MRRICGLVLALAIGWSFGEFTTGLADAEPDKPCRATPSASPEHSCDPD